MKQNYNKLNTFLTLLIIIIMSTVQPNSLFKNKAK